MKTPELSAFSDQPAATASGACADDRVDLPSAPVAYDFFGNSELLIADS